ncbi:FAD-dependent oxidoreductase [Polycladomyces subterraneus]|uniref:FAD-dependent oxidoreductase n=1 Tax=Polycladomyces subterraneus TaxID=1016997 RepID=A0ABT8IIE8_9BACL|nr:FAD-dependent oxidoreductase [Polycladomyces subterraneus]MDN4592554.1 FAD-dependent oxidoreductase [Polycladomyces subterraneus]
MQPTGGEYHVIVIGAGQAGQKAAHAVAEKGYSVLYMPANPGTMFSMMYQSPHMGQPTQIIQKPEQPEDSVSPIMQVQTFSAPGEGNGWVIQAYVSRPLSSSRKTLPDDHVVQERERFVREKMVRRHDLFRMDGKSAEPIDMLKKPAEKVDQAVPESGSSEPVYREREVHLRKKMMGYRNIGNDKPADLEPTPDTQLHIPEMPVPAKESDAAPKESLYRVEEIWAGYPSLSTSKEEQEPETSQQKKSKQHLIRLDPSRAGRRVHTFDTQASSWRSSSTGSESLVWQDNETQPESRTARPQSKSYDQISYLEAGKQKKRKPAAAKKTSLPTKEAKPQVHSPSPAGSRVATPPKRSEIPIKPKPKMVNPPIQSKERTSFLQQDAARQVLEQSAPKNALKRDSIDFEDAYGYSSWDDLFTPFSNSSKRQEFQQIEKRKLALRGLHNLINNLG